MHRMKLFTLFTSAILFYREDWERFVRFDAARKDVEKVKLWRTGAWLSVEGYSAELYIATRARDPQNFCLCRKRSHSSRTKYRVARRSFRIRDARKMGRERKKVEGGGWERGKKGSGNELRRFPTACKSLRTTREFSPKSTNILLLILTHAQSVFV